MSASFKSALGAIGPAIGIAFSARAVINFAKESVAAFAEAEAAAASLKNTIANMGGTEIQGAGMQLWVDSLERMSGFKGDELSKALGMTSFRRVRGQRRNRPYRLRWTWLPLGECLSLRRGTRSTWL
jgi:hypothetical protein